MFVISKNSSGTSFPDVLQGVKEYLNPLLNVAVPCPSCCHTALVRTHLLLSRQQSQISLSFFPHFHPVLSWLFPVSLTLLQRVHLWKFEMPRSTLVRFQKATWPSWREKPLAPKPHAMLVSFYTINLGPMWDCRVINETLFLLWGTGFCCVAETGIMNLWSLCPPFANAEITSVCRHRT